MPPESDFAQGIDPPTDAERDALREQFDTVLTVTNQSGMPMHITDDGERPICDANRGEPRDAEYKSHDMAAYPPGYKDFCLHCVRAWRPGGDDQ